MVALSGGVDSAVAAALMVRDGWEVVGVTMRLFDLPPGCDVGVRTCCAPSSAEDARRVAAVLGIPFYVVDFRSAFEEAVVAPFVRAYLTGRTPNPCVPCNGALKFDGLVRWARSVGADALATGHYARLSPRDDGGPPALLRAADPRKDQSYFLHTIRPEVLPFLRFPISDLQKTRVRALAAEFGLPVATKPESQEACFVPDGDVAAFVASRSLPSSGEGGRAAEGEIVDLAGKVLGRHLGAHHFTVGQRRGLRLGGGRDPLYVVRIEPRERRVVVGPRGSLLARGLVAGPCNFLAPPPERVTIQVRHRHSPVTGVLEFLGEPPGFVRACFDEPVAAVAPGQAAVFYDGDRLIGGGEIQASIPLEVSDP